MQPTAGRSPRIERRSAPPAAADAGGEPSRGPRAGSMMDHHSRRVIRFGHSPDPDDAFMFYGLASGRVTADGYEIVQVLKDIETLNRMALEGAIEVTAVSIHAYAYLSDRYLLLPCGASMGDGYGPIVIARRPAVREELRAMTIAVPGRLTSAG